VEAQRARRTLRQRVHRRHQRRYVEPGAERPQGIGQHGNRSIACRNGAQRDHQREGAEREPDRTLSVAGIDVAPEGEADRADDSGESERSTPAMTIIRRTASSLPGTLF
jgi:hypothetical protein